MGCISFKKMDTYLILPRLNISFCHRIGFCDDPKMSERNELEPFYDNFNLTKTIGINKISDM